MRYAGVLLLAWLAVPSAVEAAEPVCKRQSLSNVLSSLCLHEEKGGRLLSLEVDHQTVFVVRLEFASSIELRQLGTDDKGVAKYLTLKGGCLPVPLMLGEPGLLCNFTLGHQPIVKDIAFRL